MKDRYSRAQIGLHWLTALLVLCTLFLPYGQDLVADLLGGTGGVFTLHKSLGLTILLLTVLRLLVRAKHGTPDLLLESAVWQRRAAKAGHVALYLLLLLMPLSGLLFGRRPVELFWLVQIDPLPLSDGARALARQFHLTAKYLLFALILGHTAIALWHHYRLRDGVLKSMLPRRS
ncbi:cytochrome b/b6 domain-containing protein [Pseudomonas sp. MM211]|uniref:cytochrome b n=1 Tax=Pseudomonas sp. MM211 TaxID=2866808 RepID=UPI001CECD837|nr:cytochrome b/b6 domain-containing protein [Pseudomonas sp. MM211]UCJ17992.1 cytochrome b/b6 domain-containing protein [Pseudomonas sp. MM211]